MNRFILSEHKTTPETIILVGFEYDESMSGNMGEYEIEFYVFGDFSISFASFGDRMFKYKGVELSFPNTIQDLVNDVYNISSIILVC